MARTVAFSQQEREPLWLAQGKQALGIQRRTDGLGAAETELFADIGARTARRFARIAEFLEQHFPDHFLGTKDVQAGSAALLEFIRLFEIDKERAFQVAEQCLTGELGVRDLKVMREERLMTRTTPAVTSRAEGSRRAAEFAQLADRRLLEDGLFPGFVPLSPFELPAGPRALAPDFVMLDQSTGRLVAVEIKAPNDTAARSLGYVAGQLVSRVSVLRMRYDDAILVMPREAETIANETMELWNQWVTNPEPLRKGLNILLLDEKTHKMLHANDSQHDNENSSPAPTIRPLQEQGKLRD